MATQQLLDYIHSSSSHPDYSFLEKIFEKGANPDGIIYDDDTVTHPDHSPLFTAMMWGSYGLACFLLDKGANPNYAGSFTTDTILCSLLDDSNFINSDYIKCETLLMNGAVVNSSALKRSLNSYDLKNFDLLLAFDSSSLQKDSTVIESCIMNYINVYHVYLVFRQENEGINMHSRYSRLRYILKELVDHGSLLPSLTTIKNTFYQHCNTYYRLHNDTDSRWEELYRRISWIPFREE